MLKALSGTNVCLGKLAALNYAGSYSKKFTILHSQLFQYTDNYQTCLSYIRKVLLMSSAKDHEVLRSLEYWSIYSLAYQILEGAKTKQKPTMFKYSENIIVEGNMTLAVQHLLINVIRRRMPLRANFQENVHLTVFFK